MVPTKKGDLKGKVLLAALKCSDGDPNQTFSFEELLVQAWRDDPLSWGLRGFEREHPDPERLHREVDSRGKGQKGLIGDALLERVGPRRIYRLTPKGLMAASESAPASSNAMQKADRAIESEVKQILEHPVFLRWLKESSEPRRFREAGRFWGVAPGTPPKTVRDRIQRVEATLNTASALLESKNAQQIGQQHGKVLFEREDVERALEFQETLERRFAAELEMLTRER